MDYLSMVMMFYLNNQKGLIHIHCQVENHLEVHLLEDHQEEEEHLIEPTLRIIVWSTYWILWMVNT